MPSIPQSLLWISLVVLWLFVLVPMLISKRDMVRRTSDVALATRVLTSGASARLLKRAGPAAGHRSDPHWRSAAGTDGADLDEDASSPAGSVMVVAAPAEQAESDYLDVLDVDVIDEDSGALPVGAGQAQADDADAARDGAGESADADEDVADSGETDASDAADAPGAGDEYEYVEDSSGLEDTASDDDDAGPVRMAPVGGSGASRRRRYDPSTAEAVSARKYAFRLRVLMTMAAILVVSAVLAFTVTSTAWWFCGTATATTVLYLAYLRRQTRIEEQVRARRMRRMARSRFEAEHPGDRGFEVVPSRLRRPGAAVLEIDDEDPAFEHLEYATFARDYDWRHDLPRAAGQ